MPEAHSDLQRLGEDRKRDTKGFHTEGSHNCGKAVDRSVRQGLRRGGPCGA